jgi:hypothetical protein
MLPRMGQALSGSTLVPAGNLLRAIHLLPLITGENRAHHGKILARHSPKPGKLRPLLNEQFSMANIQAAHALVESGALGKVVAELQS